MTVRNLGIVMVRNPESIDGRARSSGAGRPALDETRSPRPVAEKIRKAWKRNENYFNCFLPMFDLAMSHASIISCLKRH